MVLERTKGILSRYLDDLQMRRIQISCHVFPEDAGKVIVEERSAKSDLKSKPPAAIKRAVDIMGSIGALVLLSPFFLIIPILIKRSSAGPVFFRQKRVGQFGREFTFLKFRSMAVDCDPAIHQEYVRNLIEKKVAEPSGSYKIKNDPRVTSHRRGLLRKSSLDELPQFLNVLKGEMSLVGPRPPIPYEFESYSLWHRRRILEAKPGITGAWQVEEVRSHTTFDGNGPYGFALHPRSIGLARSENSSENTTCRHQRRRGLLIATASLKDEKDRNE